MPYPFVESPNITRRASRPLDVVVMHTMEIAERDDAAAICARWFATEASQVSAHYCVDAKTVIQCVREHNIAWHARGGNTASIGVELAGFARQTRRDWGDDFDRDARAGIKARGRHLHTAADPRALARSGRPGGGQARDHGPRRGEPRIQAERPLGSRPGLPEPGVSRRCASGAAGGTSGAVDLDPTDDGSHDLERVVEDDDVGRRADGEPLKAGAAEKLRGDKARCLERRFQRYVMSDEVPHGLRHRQRAACEHAVLATRDAALDHDRLPAEGEPAVSESGGGGRVGDERKATAACRREQPLDLAREMDAVDDCLHDDVIARESGSRETRFAPCERRHCVEDVCHASCSTVEREVGLGGGGFGMTERDGNPARAQKIDELERARQRA